MPFYKFNDIFLDNKLEELLNIFGRRQCKSCIEFSTGTDLVEDPRKVRSFPLSPRAEKLYRGEGGDFDIIDFQLLDNVYHEAQEPTQMFESVNRDYSNFGVQVFSFDILNALDRKGGELITPDLDADNYSRKKNKKRRGRKNEYYKQIDQEDNEEANKMGDETRDGLGHVAEEDGEDDDEENQRKKKEEEARLAKLAQEAEEKALKNRKKEEEERRLKEEEEERNRKAKEMEEE